MKRKQACTCTLFAKLETDGRRVEDETGLNSIHVFAFYPMLYLLSISNCSAMMFSASFLEPELEPLFISSLYSSSAVESRDMLFLCVVFCLKKKDSNFCRR